MAKKAWEESRERTYSTEDLDRQVTRRWKAGDVYAPHDLSGIEMAKWKKLRRKDRPRYDVLDLLGIDPLQHYKVRD
jgi:small subunit ribosomal protein S18